MRGRKGASSASASLSKACRWSGVEGASASAARVVFDLGHPLQQRVAGFTARPRRFRPQRVERAHRGLERRADDRAGLVAAAQHREPRQRAVDLRRQRSPRPRAATGSSTSGPPAASAVTRDSPTARRQSSNASSTSASQNTICTGRRRGPLR